MEISYSGPVLAKLKEFSASAAPGATSAYNTFNSYLPMNMQAPSFGPTEGPISEVHEIVRLTKAYKDANDKTLKSATTLSQAYKQLADVANELAQGYELSTSNMEEAVKHLQAASTGLSAVEQTLNSPPKTEGAPQ